MTRTAAILFWKDYILGTVRRRGAIELSLFFKHPTVLGFHIILWMRSMTCV